MIPEILHITHFSKTRHCIELTGNVKVGLWVEFSSRKTLHRLSGELQAVHHIIMIIMIIIVIAIIIVIVVAIIIIITQHHLHDQYCYDRYAYDHPHPYHYHHHHCHHIQEQIWDCYNDNSKKWNDFLQPLNRLSIVILTAVRNNMIACKSYNTVCRVSASEWHYFSLRSYRSVIPGRMGYRMRQWLPV